jgi:small GTP-binding protein
MLTRFVTAGSVDDGKSTLIGRLLWDTRAVFEDQVVAISAASQRRGQAQPDLSLLTDGLMAEREQGITIDVAYRYFNTAQRKFIVADCPGHEQYTRNMVTGASNADVAVLLVDARKGLLPQTHRHAAVCGWLGLKRIVLTVNKIDLVDWSQALYKYTIW